MTAKDIATIIGPLIAEAPGVGAEGACLLAADEQAVAFLEAGESVVMHDDSDHYEAFDRVAAASWPGAEQMKADMAALHQWDADTRAIRQASPRGSDGLMRDEPSAVAHAVFCPKMTAAFYFGLALGAPAGWWAAMTPGHVQRNNFIVALVAALVLAGLLWLAGER